MPSSNKSSSEPATINKVNSTLVIGLTGGIGSGKSAASDYFATLGIEVIDADIVARDVVMPDTPAWQAIVGRYGPEVTGPDRNLNRAWLRQVVFADEQERRWLESETHPRVRDSIIARIQNIVSPYGILASPLLFESGQDQLTDRNLVIDIPETLQIERAGRRDNNDEAQIRRIIAAQMPRTERCRRADDIADNSTDLLHLYRQLDTLHKSYLALALQSS
ncbi:MAG: dephospho-CoA kinase [Oleibacter sp.]|nr:dephospho-CoA kinase [Thalassolituus sp.]